MAKRMFVIEAPEPLSDDMSREAYRLFMEKFKKAGIDAELIVLDAGWRVLELSRPDDTGTSDE